MGSSRSSNGSPETYDQVVEAPRIAVTVYRWRLPATRPYSARASVVGSSFNSAAILSFRLMCAKRDRTRFRSRERHDILRARAARYGLVVPKTNGIPKWCNRARGVLAIEGAVLIAVLVDHLMNHFCPRTRHIPCSPSCPHGMSIQWARTSRNRSVLPRHTNYPRHKPVRCVHQAAPGSTTPRWWD